MRNLEEISELGKTYIEYFDEIVGKKNLAKRARLQIIRPIVLRRYQEYVANRQELSLINDPQGLTEQNEDDLLSCYGNNVTLGELKVSIRELQNGILKAKCPYCLINESNTFDHYLPKGIFKEFSVLPINLIPCCSLCNQHKGEEWVRGGVRVLLNYYYDPIPFQKFLHADLIYQNDADLVPKIEFSIRQAEGINDDIYQLIERHFAKLKLIDRYESLANGDIDNLRNEVAFSLRTTTLEGVREMLASRILSLRVGYGQNFWKVALYEAVHSSDDFFRKCLHIL